MTLTPSYYSTFDVRVDYHFGRRDSIILGPQIYGLSRPVPFKPISQLDCVLVRDASHVLFSLRSGRSLLLKKICGANTHTEVCRPSGSRTLLPAVGTDSIHLLAVTSTPKLLRFSTHVNMLYGQVCILYHSTHGA